MRLTTGVHQTRVPACLVGRRPAAMSLRSAGSTKPARKDKAAEEETAAECWPQGVILVSEAFTEINAGLVIVLASGHESPVPITVLEDSNTDPDEIAHVIASAYHRHVEAYLATTYPPVDVEQAVASGLTWLSSAWHVHPGDCRLVPCVECVRPVVWISYFSGPASGVWPRHGHLRRIRDGYQGRQPNFHNGLGLHMSRSSSDP